jgi:hypothetical protein
VTAAVAPVRRKLAAAAGGPRTPNADPAASADTAGAAAHYAGALADWLDVMAGTEFGGLVCDYDGTVCATGAGHDPPGPAIRNQMLRLAETGCVLGFASGRGRSLHRELRGWIPRPLWPQVLVGMYNGGVRLPLGQDIAAHTEIPRPDLDLAASAALAEARRRLCEPPLDELTRLELRLGQITVRGRGAVPHALVAQITAAVLARPPAVAVTSVASAHAVDVVPVTVSKSAVVADAMTRTGRPMLAIGDQGQPGGNDFDLLACYRYSLSVDRCSADPTRCWNLAPAGQAGPQALLGYLAAMRPARPAGAGRLRLRWPA